MTVPALGEKALEEPEMGESRGGDGEMGADGVESRLSEERVAVAVVGVAVPTPLPARGWSPSLNEKKSSLRNAGEQWFKVGWALGLQESLEPLGVGASGAGGHSSGSGAPRYCRPCRGVNRNK